MGTRVQILVRGLVQGVGFRPFIFSLARRRALRGLVLNNTSGVLIDVESEPNAIEQFVNDNESTAPLSIIEAVERLNDLEPVNSPDVSTCPDCLEELFDVKGIGGFHLACDSLSAEAVARLRRRKYRENKPFTLMASSVEVIRKFCDVTAAEEQLLLSERRPIVLLAKRDDMALPQSVAPGVKTLGFMLPYSPLHYLLLEGSDWPLVMTSGNVSDEPICYSDEDALRRLGALEVIADPASLESYEFQLADDSCIIRVDAIIRNAMADLLDGISPQIISAKFHQAMVNVIVSVARRIREERQLNPIVLSGGVFQNGFLTERVNEELCAEAFEVFTHSCVPPNDGGVALGQAVIANALIESGSI